MIYQTYTLDRADSLALEIPLSWRDAPFVPAGAWHLIMTAKRKLADGDAAAVFQKTSDAGITVAGSTATLDIVPLDTTAAAGVLLCDIQARRISDQTVRTVARFRLRINQDVTREVVASIPIYTSQPPTVGGVMILNRLTGYYERVYINDTDGDGIAVIRTDYFSEYAPPVIPLVLNRLTGFYELLYISDTAGDAASTIKTEYYSTTPPAQPPLIHNQVTGLTEILVIDQTDGDGVATLKSEPI